MPWHEQHTVFNRLCLLLRNTFTPIFDALGMTPEKAKATATSVFQPFVVMTWLMCGGLIWVASYVRRRLSRIPKKDTTGFVEMCAEGLRNFTRDAIGPGGEEHAPFIATLFIFITLANWAGLVPGLISPVGVSEGDYLLGLNTTFALALVAIIYVHYVAIKKTGVKSYLGHFVGEPWWLFPINIPIHIVGEIARPLSLAFRLFGNVGGEDKVLHFLAITMFLIAIPLHTPMTMFAVFTGMLQAYVFTALTCSYIAGFLEHHHEVHGDDTHDEPAAAHA
jgi:F-type H+-transporting ATPase subunit a